jgi:YVTN family beta-propeller protein
VNLKRPLYSVIACLSLSLSSAAQSTFVNWEDPHVHPLDMTPDGTRLLAVNTADDRLEVFDVTGAGLVLLYEVPVGVDPVSVRARSNDEAWVVNVISDSVSVVSLVSHNVVATLKTDDEPADVVFAGSFERAFVSCGQASTVLVFDPSNLATLPTRVAIDANQPRAMAVSADGSKVYLAIFDSGNSSTILGGGTAGTNIGFPPNVVSNPAGPYGGVNPPPNSGTSFNPPINAGLPTPPKVGLIVKKTGSNQWIDDNAHDWTPMVSGASAALSGRPVGWDVLDHDVAIIDASNLSVAYADRLMNICMAIAVNPGNGRVTVVGTEATNQIRYEPNVRGKFIKVELARVNPVGPSTDGIGDLNPHLDYMTSTIPQAERDKSVGDPRGIAWNSAGTKGYVTGMGSNNVIVIDASGNRAGIAPTIPVGEGPTGIVIDEARARLYVMDKFEGAISVVSTATEAETARYAFFDPSPSAIKVGRKHLYATHENSGLGQIACASCHIDARMDHLAWDLGDPSATMAPVAGNNLGMSIPGLNTGFQDYHPMKGPMTTQTLQDIIGNEPLHWRGDRTGLEAFNPAFIGLQGDDNNLTAQEMVEYKNFLATIAFPPNPFRNFDNTLPTNLPLPGHFTTGRFAPAGQPLPNGDAVAGLQVYRTGLLDAGTISCVTCHTLPTGAGSDYRLQGTSYAPFPVGPNGEHHRALVSQDGLTNVSIKIPQLRNEYKKTGFNATQVVNRSGFGVLHDGSVDSLERFVAEPVFTVTSDQMVANLTAFMLSFAGSDLPQGSTSTLTEPPGGTSKDTHAAVGTQTTLADVNNPGPGQLALIASMISLADTNKVGLVVKGLRAGLPRGYVYLGANTFQADRAVEVVSASSLQNGAAPGSEITYTIAPKGTEIRIGVDRDLDGTYDRDELDNGTNPADPTSHPTAPGTPFCFGDVTSFTGCPCNNVGFTGRGCANSANATGAVLTSSGQVNPDTVVLHAGGAPVNAPVVFLQGDAADPFGIVFGDGVRCVAGQLRRLAVKTSAGGVSQYPEMGDLSISARSAALGDPFGPGATRYYQTYYRDSNLSFCPAPTGDSWNVTNGVTIAW